MAQREEPYVVTKVQVFGKLVCDAGEFAPLERGNHISAGDETAFAVRLRETFVHEPLTAAG